MRIVQAKPSEPILLSAEHPKTGKVYSFLLAFVFEISPKGETLRLQHQEMLLTKAEFLSAEPTEKGPKVC